MTRRGPVEVVVFTLSLVLVMATLGYLVYDGLIAVERETMLSAELDSDSVKREGEHYLADVVVRNEGDRSLSQVRVEVRQESDDSFEFEVLIPFLPQGSSKTLTLLLPRPPADSPVEVAVRSYERD